eukprot:m.84513 g.84513  ORF g.84513 m.84513 type:complete len:66 (-) comp14391_c0_seq1:28-225(-)
MPLSMFTCQLYVNPFASASFPGTQSFKAYSCANAPAIWVRERCFAKHKMLHRVFVESFGKIVNLA